APHSSGVGGTFGGNPVACAAALATIETIETDGLLERACQIERLMKDRLLALQAADDRIGDVRGRGAMIAVEFVKPDTAEPDAALTNGLAAATIAAGVVVLTAGTFGNVVRFLPPLTISDELLTEGLGIVAGLLAEL
ncbi:MAG TPA: aminotransferase class III-fold pyridoxal phosphate-dependent enzyme, partial [Mycobacterium sp.]|nr:aminotransferase class III-fold pyridoxal phosphate-dependent enzyme [Mycobacterium sp.]